MTPATVSPACLQLRSYTPCWQQNRAIRTQAIPINGETVKPQRRRDQLQEETSTSDCSFVPASGTPEACRKTSAAVVAAAAKALMACHPLRLHEQRATATCSVQLHQQLLSHTSGFLKASCNCASQATVHFYTVITFLKSLQHFGMDSPARRT